MNKQFADLFSFLLKNNSRWRIIVFVSIVLFGLLYSDSTTKFLDETEYLTIAGNVTYHDVYALHGLEPTAFRPPGYVWLLVLLMKLGAGIYLFKVMNFIALGAAALIIDDIIKKVIGRSSVIFPMLLVCIYPVLFYSAGTIYPQIIAGALLLAIIRFNLDETNSYRRDLLSGAIWGILILFIPSFAATYLVFFVYRLMRVRKAYSSLAIQTAIILLICTPWVMRNYQVFNSFRMTTNVGLNFLIGNSENSLPNSGTYTDISRYQMEVWGNDEQTIDDHFLKRGLEYVRDHPWSSLRLYLLKTANYFNYTNNYATAGQSNIARDMVMLIGYGALLLTALYRLTRKKILPLAPIERLLYLLYFSQAFIAAIFFTRIRFRLPYDLLLITLAALFLSQLFIHKNEAPAPDTA